jgi:hypothetical protein
MACDDTLEGWDCWYPTAATGRRHKRDRCGYEIANVPTRRVCACLGLGRAQRRYQIKASGKASGVYSEWSAYLTNSTVTSANEARALNASMRSCAATSATSASTWGSNHLSPPSCLDGGGTPAADRGIQSCQGPVLLLQLLQLHLQVAA